MDPGGSTKVAWYEIRVGAVLDEGWSPWFGGLELAPEPSGASRLVGPLTDDAALYGVLNQIRDLGLPLVSVRRLPADDEAPSGEAAAGSAPRPSDLAGGSATGFRAVAEVEFERARWEEITRLIQRLTDAERRAPGYFVDPDWSVKDLVAHLGVWLAEARAQLLDVATRSYVPHDYEIDRDNATILEALAHQSWSEVWTQANDARAWMLEAWFGLRDPDETASEWIRKAGAEHYGEHLPRLRAWVAELVDLRTRPVVDERDP